MTVGSYIKQNSDGGPSGTVLGQSATDLISFHGAAAVAQAAYSAPISTSTPVQANAYGFAATQAAAIVTLLNAIEVALIAKGLMAAS